jgi:two-component system sensor histidine kinase AdeS
MTGLRRLPRQPWKLSAQLVAAMTAVVVLSVIIMIGGMTLFYLLFEKLFRLQLPSDALAAYHAIDENKLPQQGDLQALLDVYKALESQLSLMELGALVVCGAVALTAGVAAGLWFARRISEPLHRVAATARRVAGGDLGARVVHPEIGGGAGETHQLIADFNLMADEMQRAERDMRESVAAIAHELRTPLTVLRGRLQGMSDGVFAPDTKGLSGLILQVDSLTQIVEDLRTLSLAMAGRLLLQPADLDLAEVMDAAIDALAPDLTAAGLTIERDLRSAPLRADPARLRQVLLVMLENARRYAISGGVARVETRRHEGSVYLRVLDRGPGLLLGEEERVFERFWRADESRSRDAGGTGLGLAVVKAIAEAHGGSAGAFARPGGGACFEIRLPA